MAEKKDALKNLLQELQSKHSELAQPELEDERYPLQCKVNKPLYEAVRKAKPPRLHMRRIVEWGLRVYLASYAPDALQALDERGKSPVVVARKKKTT